MEYALLKFVHILSATLLFGTGLGTAYFMFSAWRSGDPDALRIVTRHVVLADWLFTLPAVIVQPVTGIWLMALVGYSFTSAWFAWVTGLYVLVGACWLPVVWIQLRLKALAEDGYPNGQARFNRLMRVWTTLGGIAFAAVVALFYLMVFKPGL